jgi:hypothetical protein
VHFAVYPFLRTSRSVLITFLPHSPTSYKQGEDQHSDEGASVQNDADPLFTVERRDVGSGRALMSGPVQYSVEENRSKPKSVLEAMVWSKEMEVDRARDRWPLGPLLSRYKHLYRTIIALYYKFEEN